MLRVVRHRCTSLCRTTRRSVASVCASVLAAIARRGPPVRPDLVVVGEPTMMRPATPTSARSRCVRRSRADAAHSSLSPFRPSAISAALASSASSTRSRVITNDHRTVRLGRSHRTGHHERGHHHGGIGAQRAGRTLRDRVRAPIRRALRRRRADGADLGSDRCRTRDGSRRSAGASTSSRCPATRLSTADTTSRSCGSSNGSPTAARAHRSVTARKAGCSRRRSSTRRDLWTRRHRRGPPPRRVRVSSSS